jgi:putative FmdB family regulatory protein
MPIYEYRCQSCGHELEKLQRMSEAPLTVCPSCGKPELRRLISAAGFRLKGAGWYETDFKSAGKRNLADGPGESSAKSDGSSSESASTGTSGSGTSTKTESPAKKSSEHTGSASEAS